LMRMVVSSVALNQDVMVMVSGVWCTWMIGRDERGTVAKLRGLCK